MTGWQVIASLIVGATLVSTGFVIGLWVGRRMV
jgi:hypothetical protein